MATNNNVIDLLSVRIYEYSVYCKKCDTKVIIADADLAGRDPLWGWKREWVTRDACIRYEWIGVCPTCNQACREYYLK